MKRILLLLLFAISFCSMQGQVVSFSTVNDITGLELTPQEIVDELIDTGNCPLVSNEISPNNSVIGGEGWNSFGTFDANGTNFPFLKGIVLATNGINALNANPATPNVPGDPIGENGNFAWIGDTDLEALIEEPGNTNNATVISFDFTPYQETITFDYILASDEWPTFVCSYADTFAFILSGPGINNINDYDHDANPNTPDLSLDLGGLNIALIPGTNIPVSPTNIHDLTTTCAPLSLGEFAVPQLFAGNDPVLGYNATTVPLSVNADVIPGQTYNIQLKIADRGDASFNSAVFLEFASFELFDPNLGEDLTISGQTAACFGETIVIDSGIDTSSTGLNIFWAQDGVIIPGENSPTLSVTESGTYEAGVQTSDQQCSEVSQPRVIEFYPELNFISEDSFDLCSGEQLILNGEPLNANVYPSLDYQWFKDGTELAGETSSTLTITDGGVYELSVIPPECDPQTTVFTVNLVDYQVSLPAVPDPCISSGDTVTLSAAFTNLSQDEIDNDVTYEWTTDAGIFNTPTIDITEGQEVTLTTTFSGCDETVTETFTFFNNPIVSISGSATICQGDTITLDGTPSNLSDLTNPGYTWSLDGVEIAGETNPTLDVTNGGIYEVTVDNNGCETQSAQFELELIDYQVSLQAVPDPCISSGTTVTLVPDFNSTLTQDQIDNEVTYEWTVGADTFNTPTIELSEGQEVTLTTTFSDCEESATETFTFFNNPEVDIAGAEILCGGETNTLNATPMNLADLDQDNLTYSWTLDGTSIAGDGPVLDITEGGVYEVTITNNVCPSVDTFEVESVNYSVSFADTDIVNCTGAGGSDSVELMPTITDLTPSQENQIFYTWSDGSDGATLTVSENGTYTVDVDINGNCVQSAEVNVTFIETIQVSSNDALKCPDDSVTLQATLLSDSDPGVTYLWYSGSVPDSGSLVQSGAESTLEVEATETGDYTVVVSNQGCLSNPVTVSVNNYDVAQCVITQGISPNEDDFNDCMDLTWLNDESGIKNLQVFNRYGRKVFEENNYVDTFCGQDENGNELSTGTYFYVIELERESVKLDEGLVIKGWVYINAEQ